MNIFRFNIKYFMRHKSLFDYFFINFKDMNYISMESFAL
jgi:hypothetical protein